MQADWTLDVRVQQVAGKLLAQWDLSDAPYEEIAQWLGTGESALTGSVDLEGSVELGDVASARGVAMVRCNACRLVPRNGSDAADGVGSWSSLPSLDLGTWQLDLVVAHGIASLVQPLVIESPDLRIELDGAIELQSPLKRSVLDFTLELAFSEAAMEEHEVLRLLTETAATSARVPSPGKGVAFAVEGTLGAPRFRGLHGTSRQEGEEKKTRERDERQRRLRERKAARAAAASSTEPAE